MSGHDADIQKQVRTYKMVFAALAVFTVITVAVSYLHLPIALGVIVALIIATIKGSLVAGWFMHLKAERKAIYAVLLVTVAFFVLLLTWPLLDIGGGTGKENVVNGVKIPWDPEKGHHGESHDAGGGAAGHGSGGGGH
jgi:cytochrome c oxidase subunit 4